MTTSLPSLSCRNLARAVIAALAIAAMMLANPSSARAEQFVALGDGLVLAYASGDLDTTTLAGSAEEVRLLIDDEPLATIARLRIGTKGALTDADFTITDLDARHLKAVDGEFVVAEVTARDVPLGSLRALAEEMDTLREPALADVYALIGRVRLGSITLRGVKAGDQTVQIEIGRAAVSGVADGKVGLIEIEDGSFTEKNEAIYASVKSSRIENLSLDPRIYADADLKGLSFISDEVNVAVAAFKSETQTRLLDGAPYPAHSVATVTDLVIQPGLKADPTLLAFFKDLGAPGLRLQIDGLSTVEPQGPNLDIAVAFDLRAQTGDGIAVASGWHLPIVSWQVFSEALARDPVASDPETAVMFMANLAFAKGELAITGAGLAEAILKSAARETGVDPDTMRQQIAEEAEGALGALPDGGAAFQDAVQAFIARFGTLRLALAPAYPIPLSTMMAAEKDPQGIWDKLNITLTHSDR